MMSKNTTSFTSDTAYDSPTVWFAVLERAHLTKDRRLAQKALSRLKRLGVFVIFIQSDHGIPTQKGMSR